MRIVVAEHHALFRDGLVAFLVASGEEVVAAVASGEGALAETRAQDPDLVLLDIAVTRPDGPTTACLLAAEHPRLPVLLLGVCDHDGELVRAVSLGPRGYLLKGSDPQETLDAVARAAAGDAVISKEMARYLLVELATPPGRGDGSACEALSEAEEAYLRSLVLGSASSRNGSGRSQRLEILRKLHHNHRPSMLEVVAGYRGSG